MLAEPGFRGYTKVKTGHIRCIRNDTWRGAGDEKSHEPVAISIDPGQPVALQKLLGPDEPLGDF
jgi:hypothetical protein